MVDVPWVGGEHLPPGTVVRGQGHQSIKNIGGPGPTQQLTGPP